MQSFTKDQQKGRRENPQLQGTNIILYRINFF